MPYSAQTNPNWDSDGFQPLYVCSTKANNSQQNHPMSKHVQKKYFDEKGNFLVKPYRIIDLATIFDINRKTMRRWINQFPMELERKDGNYFSILQVEFMISKFGLPKKVNRDLIAC